MRDGSSVCSSATAPAYVFEDDLTPADCKRYLELPFDVPAGTEYLRVELSFSPLHVEGVGHVGNMICVALFDPHGFRGNQHTGGNHKRVEIGPAGATYGFRPGPLPAGRWVLELDPFTVLPGPALSYRAEVWLGAAGSLIDGGLPLAAEGHQRASAASASSALEGPPSALVPERSFQPPWERGALRAGPAWYRGDLHTHTLHSDGDLTVAQFLAMAREFGLDFVALTDHNTVSQLADPDLARAGDLLVIPGMELTTHYGHAVSLGTTRWIDWRTRRAGWRMGDAVAEVEAQGGLSILAHFAAVGDPFCTGCAWLYTDQMPGRMHAMEVWNGTWFEVANNVPINYLTWQDWLSAGHRLPAVAGTDGHSRKGYERGPAFNRVYARELSVPAILEAVAQGHVMISTGPEIYLEAELTGGRRAMMGDAVAARDVRSLTIRWRGAPEGARARLLVDGDVAGEWTAKEGSEAPPAPRAGRWALADLSTATGEMLALTNPLYFNIP